MLCLLLSACAQSPGERLVEDYLTRLEDAGGVVRPDSDPVLLRVYPGHRERTLDLPDLRIGLPGLLDYGQCGMLGLISERNSILGKVMPISQRLVYEIRFLRGAEACVAAIEASAEPDRTFLAKLRETLAIKRETLAAVFWNATFDSPELAKSLSLAVQPLAPGRDNGFQISQRAIEYFRMLARQLGDPSLTLDSAVLEQQYQVLQAEQYGGRLLVTLALLGGALYQASTLLETVANRPDPCRTPAGESLPAVHREMVGPRLRPYLDQVREQGRRWLGALGGLLEAQSITPPEVFADYYRHMLSLDSRNGLWQRFERAWQRHRRLWYELLKRCGQGG